MTAAEKRLNKARTLLVLDQPFFGALSLRLDLEADPSLPTAAVDGRTIYFNPAWVDGLTDAECRGVMAHEVLHCAMGHCWRRGERDPGRWNTAADAEINHQLITAGFTLPGEPVPGQDRSAEAIYADLGQGDAGQEQQDSPGTAGNGTPSPAGQQNSPQQGGTQPSPTPDPGGCGAVVDAPPDNTQANNGQNGAPLRDQWEIAVVQAAKAARGYGHLPAIGKRLLDDLTRPALDWRTLLADFVQCSARSDYNWGRCNRAHAARGIFTPTLRNNELPAVVVAIDNSGSIDNATASAFAQAVSDILSTYQTTAHVLTCDTEVNETAEYTSADLPIKVDVKAGGGTDFRPVFTWIDEHSIDPAALIYLTDLECSKTRFPEVEPDYPVLWVSTDPSNNERAPWGAVVDMVNA